MYSMISIWSILLQLLYLTKAVKRLNSKCSHHKEFFLCFKNLYIYIYVYEMFTKLTCSINHYSLMIWLMLYPLHLSVLYVNYILNKLGKKISSYWKVFNCYNSKEIKMIIHIFRQDWGKQVLHPYTRIA